VRSIRNSLTTTTTITFVPTNASKQMLNNYRKWEDDPKEMNAPLKFQRTNILLFPLSYRIINLILSSRSH